MDRAALTDSARPSLCFFMHSSLDSFIETARSANQAAHLAAANQLAALAALDREAYGQDTPSLNKVANMIRGTAAAGPAVTHRLLEARAALLSLQSETLHSIADAIAMLEGHAAAVLAWEDDKPGRDLIETCEGIALNLAILNAPAGDRPPATPPEALAAAVAPLIENAAANGSKPAFLHDVLALTSPK